MNPDHVHAGAIDFVATFAHVVLALAIMRAVALRWPDSPFGEAFAFLSA